MTGGVLTFGVIAFFVVLTPGADTLLVLRTSLANGFHAGFITATGVVVGPIVWGALAGAGIANLVQNNHTIFVAVSLLGAAFLLYLAAGSFIAARRAVAIAATLDESDELKGTKILQ